MKIFIQLLVASIALLALNEVRAVSETFTIDSNHTFPMFEATHFGISAQRGRFNKTTGKVTLDREAKAGSIDIVIDTASIDMGFEKWDQHMKNADFFNVEKFPTMSFKSKKLIFDGDKLVGADGEFTLLGITKPLRLKVSNFACTQHPMLKKLYCGAEVSAEIKRSDFGMKTGIPVVGDEVKLLSPVEALKD